MARHENRISSGAVKIPRKVVLWQRVFRLWSGVWIRISSQCREKSLELQFHGGDSPNVGARSGCRKGRSPLELFTFSKTAPASWNFCCCCRWRLWPGDQAVSQPSVFVLRSEGTEDDKSACLAKDFFPKEVAIFMNTSSTNTGLQKAVSILSNSGKYSAVHVSNFSHAEDVHCTVRHQAADITDKEVSRKPKDGPKATPKQAQECEPTQSSPIVHSKEKVNTLSLTVMGLRVLFAKSLAFNFLLSVRFFMF